MKREIERALGTVIKEVPAPVAPEPSSEVLVTIDCNPTRKFWQRKDEKYFLVSFNGTAERHGLRITVEDPTNDWRIQLSVEHRARCGRDGASKLVEALRHGTSLEEQLDRMVEKLIGDYVARCDSPAEFIIKYNEHKTGLERFVREQAQAAAGLILSSFKVNLDTEKILDPLPLKNQTIPVFLRDYPKQVQFTVISADLRIHSDPEIGMRAHIQHEMLRELPRLVAKRISEFASSNITLDELHAADYQVRSRIEEDLNVMLKEHGRRIVGLDYKVDAQLPEVKPSWPFSYTFKHKVPDFRGDTSIDCSGTLDLISVSVFASHPKLSLQKWVEAALERLIRQHIAGMGYAQLFREFEATKKAVRADLDQEARKIGYRVLELQIDSDLPFEIVKKPFEVRVVNYYTTSEPEFKVQITVNARVRIPEPTKIEQYVNQKEEVRERVVAEIAEIVKRRVRDRTPENIYLYFDKVQKNKDTRQAYEPLQEQLNKEIAARLDKEFGAKVLWIDCEADGELLQELRKLEAETAPITVRLTRANYGVTVKYYIHGILPQNWHRFQATRPDIVKLSGSIEDFLRQAFADVDPAQFKAHQNSHWLNFLNQTNSRSLHDYVREKYGLNIFVEHWIRGLTEAEVNALDTRERVEVVADKVQKLEVEDYLSRHEDALQSKQEERRQLLEEKAKRLEEIRTLDPTNAGDKKQIDQLRAEVDELNRKLQSFDAGDVPEIMKQATERQAKDLKWALAQSTVGAARQLTSGPSEKPANEESVIDAEPTES